MNLGCPLATTLRSLGAAHITIQRSSSRELANLRKLSLIFHIRPGSGVSSTRSFFLLSSSSQRDLPRAKHQALNFRIPITRRSHSFMASITPTLVQAAKHSNQNTRYIQKPVGSPILNTIVVMFGCGYYAPRTTTVAVAAVECRLLLTTILVY